MKLTTVYVLLRLHLLYISQKLYRAIKISEIIDEDVLRGRNKRKCLSNYESFIIFRSTDLYEISHSVLYILFPEASILSNNNGERKSRGKWRDSLSHF